MKKKKIKVFILIMLVGILLVGSVACGGGISKPSVGFVPEGWELIDEAPYGAYNLDGKKFGSMLYEDADGDSFVVILYGDSTDWQTGLGADGDNLIARVLGATMSFHPGETGIMTVGDRSASYFKTCIGNLCEMGITFLKVSGWAAKGTTWIGIYTAYHKDSQQDVMSLIDSVYF